MVTIKDFDMPDSCLRCPFCLRDTEAPRCVIDKIIGGGRNTTWERLDSRPEWCPLMTVQNRKECGECVCTTCENRDLCCSDCEGTVKSCEEYESGGRDEVQRAGGTA